MQSCYTFAGFELLTAEWVSAIGTVAIGVAAAYYARAQHKLLVLERDHGSKRDVRRERAARYSVLAKLRSARAGAVRMNDRMSEIVEKSGLYPVAAASQLRKCAARMSATEFTIEESIYLDEATAEACATVRGELAMFSSTLEAFACHVSTFDADSVLSQGELGTLQEVGVEIVEMLDCHIPTVEASVHSE